MNVLLLGGTGTLGSRLVPALLSHAHHVTILVQNKAKFLNLMPPIIHNQVQVVEGDAKDGALIATTLQKQSISWIINAAGAASFFAKESNPLIDIAKATVQAADATIAKMKKPIRVWFFGGLLLLDAPGGRCGATLES